MTVAEIEAIVGGYHGDPFRILGPHRIEKPRGTPRWEVRVFLPQAESAEVVLGDQRVALIAPLLVDRHQIGDADAFARPDEAGGPAA